MSDSKADWDAATVPIFDLAKRLAEIEQEIRKYEEHGLVVPSDLEGERNILEKRYDESLRRALDNLRV